MEGKRIWLFDRLVLDSNGIWSGNLGVERKRGNGKVGREVFEVGTVPVAHGVNQTSPIRLLIS